MAVEVHRPVLVIGASGLVGRRLTSALLARGHAVRCFARNPASVEDLAKAGCDIRQGDITDRVAVESAVDSVQAVYVTIHTLSPQPGASRGVRFMDIERQGLENVLSGCWAEGVRRIVYVTSLGISPDVRSEWLRERWQIEQQLLESGLDTTVIRPGHIVGVGGRGFDTMLGDAKRRFALTLGGDRPKMRTIGIEDVIYYLIAVLDDVRTFHKRFDVGNDEVLSTNELIDGIADVIGRRRPAKVQLPLSALRGLAPIIDRIGHLPEGAMRGLLDSLDVDLVGDPRPLQDILPRRLLSFSEAVLQAVDPGHRVR